MGRNPSPNNGLQVCRISLLHATYRRQASPLEIKSAWLEQADFPESIEYIIAMNSDDETSIESTEGHLRVFSGLSFGHVTAVKNWNAAAESANGDLLMVIADDLWPAKHWDSQILDLIGTLDPQTDSFAIKINDSDSKDDILMRHPIVSRKFYAMHGLFSATYRGVYCDNDITLRAFWHSAIIDGRSIEIEHRHPFAYEKLSLTRSQSEINRRAEYSYGETVFLQSWPAWKRRSRPHLTLGGRNLHRGVLYGRAVTCRFIERLLIPYRKLRANNFALGIYSRVKSYTNLF